MEAQLNACGVILAGGKSSRMGVNKALLDFEGEPLVQRLARRFQRWFAQVVVVTNTPDVYAFLDLPMTADRVPGLGPLGGLEAGLTASRFDHAFFCACDMPFVNEALVRHLAALAPGHDIVVPQLDGEFEPMHAIYSRSLLPRIQAHLESRRLRLTSIFDGALLRAVTEAEIRQFGDPEQLFFNCNTPAEFEQAKIWRREP
ncbi:MAG: molybdopterin-guanine dinucleotide biosynthesis protein [Firmicutes bacterium]|nr:molybdopterin-guanine dinucleotide biosynthesis protein [Bacillota bacterium]